MSAAYRVAIIGAGFSGLGAAIRLKAEGIEDFVILERAAQIGGTWRENRYPGCGCDVPSHLYCYSFAPNPGWSRTFSARAEIWEYLRECVERYGLAAYLRTSTEVRALSWHEPSASWLIETAAGELRASVVVGATGALSEPSLPPLPGIASFEGPLFHSADWPEHVDLRGARVALLGTGASAVQIAPQIQPIVEHLTVYQRTPPWVLPHPGRRIGELERWIYRRAPAAQRLLRGSLGALRDGLVVPLRHPALLGPAERLARRHLHRQVADPALRAVLTPDYRIGCKRILISNDYFPALAQPNVTLVAHAVSEVRPNSIVAADGVERPAEVIVAATGFRVMGSPLLRRIRGRDGRTLAEHWNGRPAAHRGTTVAGFPNLFLLLGPFTGVGHTSVLLMIEAQIGYLVEALREMDERGLTALEPRAGAQAAFVAQLRRRSRGTVWESGCASWYLDAAGHSVLWPDSARRFRRIMRRFDLASYDARPYSSGSG